MRNHVLENVDAMQFSVVIPSLEPGAALSRLMHSLVPHSGLINEIIIVDQSTANSFESCVKVPPELESKISVLKASPGLSKARNIGLGSLSPGSWDVVLIPDDDVVLGRSSLVPIMKAIRRGVQVGSGRLASAAGESRIDFPDSDIQIDRGNVWSSSIEACFFMTPDALRTVGGYDESLGLGAETPWQSGEGTDLLLRALDAGLDVEFVSKYVLFDPDTPPLDQAQLRARHRKYARGTGRVYRTRYGYRSMVKLIARSVLRILHSIVTDPRNCLISFEILIGRLEGMLGRRK